MVRLPQKLFGVIILGHDANIYLILFSHTHYPHLKIGRTVVGV